MNELGVDAPTGPCGRVVELLSKMHGHPEQEAIDLPCHLSRATLTYLRRDIKYEWHQYQSEYWDHDIPTDIQGPKIRPKHDQAAVERLLGILRRVRHVGLFLGAALLTFAQAPASAAVGTAAEAKAKLRLLDTVPVTVRGVGFVARERVSVSVRGLGGMTRKSVTAGPRGGWTTTFRNRAFDRCEGLIVGAVGNRGSRAGLRLPPGLCPPPRPAP